MAVEVLSRNVVFSHSYWHDVESVLYVLCWVCTLYCGPNNSKRCFADHPFSECEIALWNGGPNETMKSIGGQKLAVVIYAVPFFHIIVRDCHEYFKPLFGLLEDFRDILFPDSSKNTSRPNERRGKRAKMKPPPKHRAPEDFFADVLSVVDSCIGTFQTSTVAPPPPGQALPQPSARKGPRRRKINLNQVLRPVDVKANIPPAVEGITTRKRPAEPVEEKEQTVDEKVSQIRRQTRLLRNGNTPPSAPGRPCRPDSEATGGKKRSTEADEAGPLVEDDLSQSSRQFVESRNKENAPSTGLSRPSRSKKPRVQ